MHQEAALMKMETQTIWDSKLGRHWRSVLVVVDAIIVLLSFYLAFLTRFDGTIPPRYLTMMVQLLPVMLIAKLLSFRIFRIYRFSWSYIGFEELLNIIMACIFSSLMLTALLYIFYTWSVLSGFPRSILAIDFAFTFMGVAAIRSIKRAARHLRFMRSATPHGHSAIIVGAGYSGEQLVRSLLQEENINYWPVGILDDDPGKQGISIHGVPVLGTISHLPDVIKSKGVQSVLIAIPSAPSRTIRDTVELARQGGAMDIKVVPFLSELYTGEFRVSDIRKVQPEDILAREPVSIDMASVEHFLRDKNVLVTGAAGSIGSELCRQVLRFSPAMLLALDFDETGLFNLESDLRRIFPKKNIRIVVGDIRDRPKIHQLFQRLHPQVIFHAAAYKHVPMMEEYPEEAAKTNVFGTKILMEEACEAKTEAFVLISTDKAVNPVSVMGMSKRVAEIISLSVGENAATRCIAVRFGNVLGSRGSVVPTFMEQIRRGGPVTVTHPDMERYFMTISEAVLLVLQAGAMGKGGEVFVLDMGKQVKILDIAKELIRFHNQKPDEDIPIVFTGIRPGEKLREELLTAEEGIYATTHKQIYIAKMNNKLSREALSGKLEILGGLSRKDGEGQRVREMLSEIIDGSNEKDG